jgi:hypothetical protein
MSDCDRLSHLQVADALVDVVDIASCSASLYAAPIPVRLH